MFETTINHFLQSFAFEGLTNFMQYITALGYQQFFMVFLGVLLFTIDFKKAFVLFMVLLWTGGFTYILKDYFGLPRPYHVDNTLEKFDTKLPDQATFDFSKRDAESFWGSLPTDVVETTRKAKSLENGFPSGHASVAIAFWGALALLYRRKWIQMISISLMILIPLSRLYLGVHFLADVVGGITLGFLMLGGFYSIILKPEKLQAYLEKDKYPITANKLSAVLLISPFFFLFILPVKAHLIAAYLLGFGIGFLLIGKKGLPLDEAPWYYRIGRLMIGILLFVGVTVLMKMIADKVGLGDNVWADFIGNAIAGFALMWGATEISIRIGWFKRAKETLA